MLTLINQKRKLYLSLTNIVILITMFVALINVFFNQYYQILFLALYLPLFIGCYILLCSLYFCIHKNNGFGEKKYYAFLSYYFIDLIIQLIALLFAIINIYFSFFIIASLVSSVIRMIYYNLLWNFNYRS